MSQTQPDRNPSPRGVIATISAGFELTTNNIWLVVLPVLVDIFYWLGPRLSVAEVVARNLAPLRDEPALSEMADSFTATAAQINLFTSLSVPLIGLPALMSGPIPERTPLETSTIPIDRTSSWLIMYAALSLVGLALATLYLRLISEALRRRRDAKVNNPGTFVGKWALSVIRIFGLGIVLIFTSIVVSLPLLPFAVVASLLSSQLFLLVLLFGLLFVILYLSMSVPAIVFGGFSLGRAILDGVRLVHGNRTATINLLLFIFLIGNGMNLLWHLADDGSWLTLVSIAGHGFISTALMAALFIFFRDRYLLFTQRLNARNQSQIDSTT